MNTKLLIRSILQSLFACVVVASTVILYHVCLMTNHLQAMGIVGFAIFFALTWEFYFFLVKEHQREVKESMRSCCTGCDEEHDFH